MNEFAQSILTIVIVVIGFLVRLFIFYGVGTIYDYFMGTSLLPIFVLGGVVGLRLSLTKSDTTSPIRERIAYAAKIAALVPFVALVGAAVASFVFPGLVQEFLQIASYEGSIYFLAFFGVLLMALMTFILRVVGIFIGELGK
mgnify:CR=1 FL=1